MAIDLNLLVFAIDYDYKLKNLRKEAKSKSPTQEQIQKPAQDGRGSLNEIERQLEELDKLRSGR